MATTTKPIPQTEPADGPDLPPIRELTPEEARQHFDESTRRLLGISSAEFFRRLDAGELDPLYDDRDHPWVGYLVDLSPIGR